MHSLSARLQDSHIAGSYAYNGNIREKRNKANSIIVLSHSDSDTVCWLTTTKDGPVSVSSETMTAKNTMQRACIVAYQLQELAIYIALCNECL